MGYPAVFLDKDGTLIDNVPYNVDPRQIRLAAGAVEGLRILDQSGFRLVVITNQSGVARGCFPETALHGVEAYLCQVLSLQRIPLAGFYYCPHHPDGLVEPYAIRCDCRKPAPGMLLKAATDLDIDLKRSWFVGDILNDIEAGRRAGCQTVLIDNGNETEWELTSRRIPDYIADNVLEAAQTIYRCA